MSAAVPLREDFGTNDLRHLARTSHDADQIRRLLMLATIYDGGRRMEAARVGAVGLQTVRDWVLAFNADGPAGLVDEGAGSAAPAQRRAAPGARAGRGAWSRHVHRPARLNASVLISARWYDCPILTFLTFAESLLLPA